MSENDEYCERMAKSAERQAKRFKRKGDHASASAWTDEAAFWRSRKGQK